MYKKIAFIISILLCITMEVMAQDTYNLRYHLRGIDSLNNLSEIAYKSQNYTESIRLGHETLLLKATIFGEEHTEYATSLNNLAYCYAKIGNYAEAIRIESKSLSIKKRLTKEKSLPIASSLNNLAYYHLAIGDYQEAIKLQQEVLIIKEEILGKKHNDYAIALGDLAYYYSAMGNYIMSIKLQHEVIASQENILGKEHPDYATSLVNLAYYYAKNCDYATAIDIQIEASNIKKKHFGPKHIEYATTLEDLAYYYSAIDCNVLSIKIQTKVLEILKNTSLDQRYTIALDNLAYYYSEIGDYINSINTQLEVLSIKDSLWGEEHPEYATSLNNLAHYYAKEGNYSKAIETQKKASKIKKESLGEHPDYIKTLNYLAYYYSKGNNYAKAIETQHEALELHKKISEKDHRYANSLHDLAYYYSLEENYKKAIEILIESSLIKESIIGVEHPDYINLLDDLCDNYYKDNQIDKFLEVLSIFYQQKLAFTKETLSSHTLSNRTAFWNKESLLFRNDVPYYTFKLRLPALEILSYNSALINKSIILDTAIEFSRTINNDTIYNLYKDLQEIRGYINDSNNKLEYKDSLEFIADERERQLIKRSQTYGDFTRNLSIDWKQVQKKLSKSDIAIEFVSFPIGNDSTMYCALTLKKEYDAPKMISLFEAKQLDSINRNEYYENLTLAELVWEPLEEELQDVKNVYFAPDGELYNIAIESLPHYSKEGYVFDEWNFYRLSSTRELAKIKYQSSQTKAALYGGLNYDIDITAIEDSQQSFDELYIAQYRSEPDSIGLRARYGTLRGTLDEVQLIDSLYMNLKYPSIVYAHNIGTETSLKKLDGQKVSNLHIATHGFYWTETELNEKKDLRELPFIKDYDRPRFIEDKAMTRSGLLFAGANKVLSGKSIPEGYDDGILTAKEISTLDLRSLDLLVLSACQTGLGEIKGDGVYGLQRGFKMAGAQTIVMSLWKVDDDATQMLMTEFYKRFLSGQSKHEAFLAAQETVRNFKGKIRGKDKNFSDPKYWAGFVMLD